MEEGKDDHSLADTGVGRNNHSEAQLVEVVQKFEVELFQKFEVVQNKFEINLIQKFEEKLDSKLSHLQVRSEEENKICPPTDPQLAKEKNIDEPTEPEPTDPLTDSEPEEEKKPDALTEP